MHYAAYISVSLCPDSRFPVLRTGGFTAPVYPLNFDERLQLMYAKGSRYYEDEPVFRSALDDIDMDFVAEYCKKIGYSKSAEEYIRQNKDYISGTMAEKK